MHSCLDGVGKPDSPILLIPSILLHVLPGCGVYSIHAANGIIRAVDYKIKAVDYHLKNDAGKIGTSCF